MGSQRLDYEDLATIAAQIESCLNSRPLLTTTSHSPDGVQVLTPGPSSLAGNSVLTRNFRSNLNLLSIVDGIYVKPSPPTFGRGGRWNTSNSYNDSRSGGNPHLTYRWATLLSFATKTPSITIGPWPRSSTSSRGMMASYE